MDKQILKTFGKILISNKSKVDFKLLNKVALMNGYFVPENLCYTWLYTYFLEHTINPNSTFYSSWNDIASKNREELFLDQLKHYASTYGTDFQSEAWVPNEDNNLIPFSYKDIKILEGITEEELATEIKILGSQNIAFLKDTLDLLFFYREYLDIPNIKNRELKLRCIDENYTFTDGQECLLWILYKFFNISMLVKNKETFEQIKPSKEMKSILNKNKNILSSVFYRNKDVFMQFKKEPSLRPIVNKIRRLAPSNHKPMKKSIWLRLEELTNSERAKLFDSASIFKLVQIYNTLSNPSGYYIIRNGKAFYKESKTKFISVDILLQLIIAIKNKLPKIESVALPENIELAMPTSEKNFIGEIPLGSYVKCSDKNTMIGIYWRNEWGARDLDLHAYTASGLSVGWNVSYYNEDAIGDKNVLFSGDMTDASPEASEVMWFKNQPEDSIISVSKYSGGSEYEYDMFIAQEEATDFKKNYMVKEMIFKTRLVFRNRSDVTLGFFKDGKFIFHSCNVGNGQIPSDWREKILNHLTNCQYLTIRQVLEFSDIKIDPDSENKIESKADLLKFFS